VRLGKQRREKVRQVAPRIPKRTPPPPARHQATCRSPAEGTGRWSGRQPATTRRERRDDQSVALEYVAPSRVQHRRPPSQPHARGFATDSKKSRAPASPTRCGPGRRYAAFRGLIRSTSAWTD
jgi:hypothetical protein